MEYRECCVAIIDVVTTRGKEVTFALTHLARGPGQKLVLTPGKVNAVP